jgi:hypothetical protein
VGDTSDSSEHPNQARRALAAHADRTVCLRESLPLTAGIRASVEIYVIERSDLTLPSSKNARIGVAGMTAIRA